MSKKNNSKEQAENLSKEEKEYMQTEYNATNAAYLHYDNYSWLVGSVLIAGVFVFWGFLLQVENLSIWVSLLSSALIFAIMTCWILYTFHNRQIYLYKLHRLWEIEGYLGMFQHRRFNKDFIPDKKEKNIKYVIKGCKGNQLEIAIYLILSNGTFLLSLVKEVVCVDKKCINPTCCCNHQWIILSIFFVIALIISLCIMMECLKNVQIVKKEISEIKNKE